MVFREVTIGQIARAVRLVIQAVIDLRVVAEVGRILGVDEPVHAAAVASLEERTRDNSCRLSRKSGRRSKSKFVKRSSRLFQALVLAFTFERKETEEFVFADRAPNGAAKLLPAVRRVCGSLAAVAIGILFVRVQ